MNVRVIHAHEGETGERTNAPIFEGGPVWSRDLTGAEGSEHLNVNVVHFGPGARAGWHRHTSDQVLYVVNGIGKVGDREGEQVITAGDSVVIPADTDHWHGAHDSGSPMSHLSIMKAGADTTALEE